MPIQKYKHCPKCGNQHIASYPLFERCPVCNYEGKVFDFEFYYDNNTQLTVARNELANRYLIELTESEYMREEAEYEMEQEKKCKCNEPLKIESYDAQNKTHQHAFICKELNSIYEAKNADYGDSFGKSYKEYGMTMPLIRLEDKLNRLKSLSKSDAKVKDESIEDTLLDLANYAIMTVIELRGDK